MNYYPFYQGLPQVAATATKTGIFKNLFGSLSLGKILSGSQKTLSFVNQALPLVKQATPMLNNFKTMFKVMNEFKNIDNVPVSNNDDKKDTVIKNEVKNNSKPVLKTVNNIEEKKTSNNSLTFFL